MENESGNNDRVTLTVRGRGTGSNPANRFVKLDIQADPDAYDADAPPPATTFLDDTTRNIIATNNSPDVGFDASINPYRGCEHGCIYCYARPFHEYLGFSAGLDFETKIMVKRDAAELLRKELAKPGWEPRVLQISGVTDCYQPIEKKLRITRSCLEVLAECRNPCTIITKNFLITRDIDLLSQLAEHGAVAVMVSVTSLDASLTRVMEPRTSVPARKLEAISRLAEAKIPIGVMVAPVIPGLTDHEIPSILKAAKEAGARFCGHVPLRLPHAVGQLFEEWLDQHFPDRKEKVLNRLRSMRGGKLSDPRFGSRMRGEGIWAEQIHAVFKLAKRRIGIDQSFPTLRTDGFRAPAGPQMSLW